MHTNTALKTPDDFIADGHTPMMAQYMAVKQQHPGTLLFYRMGDFFELFFDDAVTASTVLDITLTKRGRTGGDDIPMCGVPAHAHEQYLARLIKAGYKVAICDQTETPEQAKARGGYKALVTRDVTRIVTPGTLTEDTLLDARQSNYLSAIVQTRGDTALAWVDISTGVFHTERVAPGALAASLARIAPREILVPDKLYAQEATSQTLALYERSLTVQSDSLFDANNADLRIKTHYNVDTLDAFGTFSVAEITAAGTLLDYVERTQKAAVMHLQLPRQIHTTDIMGMDAATRRNLELTETLSGDRRGSLLHTIDKTVTAAGARLLHARLMAPLCNVDAIHHRLDQVTFFHDHAPLRAQMRAALKTTPDMERALARLSLNRGSPRDLAAVRDGLRGCAAINHILQTQNDAPPAITALCDDLRQSPAAQHICDTLTEALSDDLPALTQDGGFIRGTYDPALDAQRALRDDGRRMIVGLQQKYATHTGIDSLKIAHNNILGYYIEAPAKKGDALFGKPDTYIHRQTMANAVRFTTVELSELERGLSQAAAKALAIELDLFAQLTAQVTGLRAELVRLAAALAALDVAAALADLATTDHYTRPNLRDDRAFHITAGRHSVVETALKTRDTAFIPNDADLSPDQSLWLLTGPNMAGKSTFLRQNALIIVLAQMGSFVPATHAEIGIVDKLFSRVGASDDLASGRSTFMVEMVETAAILNQATARSFVILDEIGRGTATFDGLSIAWATLEYLHDHLGCRGLFATHYHELTGLHSRMAHLFTATMDVQEWDNAIVFLHTVRPGTADRSYGIHVGKLAGLPAAVTIRAEQILAQLEHDAAKTGNVKKLIDDLPLFTTAIPPAPTKPSAVEQRLATIDPDSLTARDALDLIYELKSLNEK